MSIKLAAAKIIFYGYMSLQSYENVEFVTNSPMRHEKVIDTKQLHLPTNSSYYNVLKNGHGYDFIFRDKHHSCGGSTSLYNTETKNLVNLIQNTFLLNHNFCVTESHDGHGYYGIGGMQSRYFINFAKATNSKLDEPPPISYANTQIVSPYSYSKYHDNGLYVMYSPDMIHWEYVTQTPVISGIHPGQTDHFLGYSLFDSKICCFYSGSLEQYILFCRANMGRGRRWIQVTHSRDLIHWEPFQLLEMDGVDFNNDNYYHLDVIEYPETDLFIGLSPYANKPQNPTETCIKLMFSKDGVHWVDSGSILKTPVSSDGLRNSTHSTSVFFDRGRYYDMFFNENYNGLLNPSESATVVKYKIPKDRLIGAKPKSENVAKLSFIVNIRSDTITLNYDCHDDGYIRFSINDDGYEFILNGNHLNKEVEIGSKYTGHNVLISVEMKNCTLYSCTG